MFLRLLLPCLSLASAPFPDNMLGTFQLETSEGVTNYLYEVGVDWFTRKIACSLYPTATNELVDGQIEVTTTATREGNTLVKNGENVFNLGEPFTKTTADGREVTTTAWRPHNMWANRETSSP